MLAAHRQDKRVCRHLQQTGSTGGARVLPMLFAALSPRSGRVVPAPPMYAPQRQSLSLGPDSTLILCSAALLCEWPHLQPHSHSSFPCVHHVH
jgi:hypothetical protein